MILIIILFVLVILISLLLAYLSMKDYKESPKSFKKDYALFLVRKSENLTATVLNSFYEKSLPKSSIISFERLFKDGKSALTIFGPKNILTPFLTTLDLLELEDYTDVYKANISVWEIGVKREVGADISTKNMFENFPMLLNEEHFWFQLIIKPHTKDKNGVFASQLRIVSLSADSARRKTLLEYFLKPPFVKIPRPYSGEKMFKFYKDRTIGLDDFALSLKPTDVLKLISLN